MFSDRGTWISAAAALAAAVAVSSCAPAQRKIPHIPRGYVSTLQLQSNGKNLSFGPFVGYYFRPVDPRDLRRLRFVCFNEQSFYTRDVPEGAPLFEGTAVRTALPDLGVALPRSARINPLFFDEAPKEWIETRPAPPHEFLHFHSCYSAVGPALTGYWLRHVSVTNFTYDMGGRVESGSPLYHVVEPGVDTNFARIIEFDAGPG